MRAAAMAGFKSAAPAPKITGERCFWLAFRPPLHRPPEPVSPAPPTSLDHDALQRLRDLDPLGKSRLIERVLGAFETSAARLSAQLVEARRDDDIDGIRLVAHTLKSSSASIGALALSSICAEIESQVRRRKLLGLSERLEAMDVELIAVLKAVKALLKDAPT